MAKSIDNNIENSLKTTVHLILIKQKRKNLICMNFCDQECFHVPLIYQTPS